MVTDIQALKAIYEFYDNFLAGTPMACKKGCSICCTTNVSVTSLEARYILASGLLSEELESKIDKAREKEHFIPSTTINTSAAMCLSGNQVPEETSPRTFDPCPLLSPQGLCTIYPVRPFSCRAMSSETPCPQGGEAYMSPFLITVNLALYQVLEHLDQEGWYGNLLDVLPIAKQGMEGASQLAQSLEGVVKTNRPLPCFIIPPEDTIRFKALMRRLAKVEVQGGGKIGELLPEDWQIIT